MPTITELLATWECQIQHEDIDEFVDLLTKSAQRRLGKLENKENTLSPGDMVNPDDLPDYRDYLCEQIANTRSVMDLGGQLSILALYKRVEEHRGKMVQRYLPSVNPKKLSDARETAKVLMDHGIEVERLNGYTSLEELRLLNNSIKHGRAVSSELSKANPKWTAGVEINSVGDAYDRLLPGVADHVRDLVSALQRAAGHRRA